MDSTTYTKGGFPLTHYNVTVVSNIKGELPLNETVPLIKSGGISQDATMYILYNDDSLPELGKYYICSTNLYKDGCYWAGGPNSTRLISLTALKSNSNSEKKNAEPVNYDMNVNEITSDTIIAQLEESDAYLEYKDAFENVIPFPYAK